VPVTIYDVAREAGVDIRTVSRVLNNHPYVSEGVRARVEAAIAELGFVPNRGAQGLAFKRTFTIALAIGSTNADFVASVLFSTSRVAAAKGYTVVVVHFDPREPSTLASVANLARRKQADGLILVAPWPGIEEQIARLLPAGFPWVYFGRRVAIEGVPAVTSQGQEGVAELIGYLLDAGHRRIAYVSGRYFPFRERLAGFEAAMAARGVPVDPRYVVELEQPTFSGGVESGRALLALDPRPTAICAANDLAAAGVLAAAHAAGIRVPEELSVAGYDDFAVAQQTLPPLTTIPLPVDEMSRIASEMLIDQINGKPPKELHVRVPVSLVIRGSTGPWHGE
jgi:LacI family transcriptional regulator